MAHPFNILVEMTHALLGLVILSPIIVLMLYLMALPFWLLYSTIRYPHVLGSDRACDRGIA